MGLGRKEAEEYRQNPNGTFRLYDYATTFFRKFLSIDSRVSFFTAKKLGRNSFYSYFCELQMPVAVISYSKLLQ